MMQLLTPTLTVNTAAIVANWQQLRAQFSGRETAAVVKADAYGLGMLPVAKALAEAGCHTFFVAHASEGVALRAALKDVRVLVFHGVQAGEEFAFVQHRLIPVLNSAEQLARWRNVAVHDAHAVSALHIDTAMARLGLQPEAFFALLQNDADIIKDCRVSLLMSHLACAPDASHPSNAMQREAFAAIAAALPEIPRSLCNSGGIYLGRDYHCDLARPGCSLYGIAPQSHAANPMQPVAQWHAPILQIRTLQQAQAVGYGATQTLSAGTRVATVASGYADGYHRMLSGNAVAYAAGIAVPLVGRVTMDMLCFDVSAVPTEHLAEGDMLTLLGDHNGIRVDELASAAQTIGYEILTSIGPRVVREYRA